MLAVSPQYLDGRLIGTVDTSGELGVAGPPDPEKCNDYIAAAVRTDPSHFIGFGSVNPAFKGPAAAVAELDRAVSELGLSGVKLYPMYQHWAANDRDLAFPIYAKASELGIPVMIHQAGVHPHRRETGAGPPGDAGRHRAGVPRPAGHHRPLRDPLGRRGPVPADQAPELLHRAVLPDRHPDPAGPVLAAAPLRARVRAAGEDLLRHRLPRLPLRPGQAGRTS